MNNRIVAVVGLIVAGMLMLILSACGTESSAQPKPSSPPRTSVPLASPGLTDEAVYATVSSWSFEEAQTEFEQYCEAYPNHQGFQFRRVSSALANANVSRSREEAKVAITEWCVSRSSN